MALKGTVLLLLGIIVVFVPFVYIRIAQARRAGTDPLSILHQIEDASRERVEFISANMTSVISESSMSSREEEIKEHVIPKESLTRKERVRKGRENAQEKRREILKQRKREEKILTKKKRSVTKSKKDQGNFRKKMFVDDENDL